MSSEPEVGEQIQAVLLRGGLVGDYTVVLEREALAEACRGGVPTYTPGEIELLSGIRERAELVKAVALVKRELRFPGDEPRLIEPVPGWDVGAMVERLEGEVA